MNVNTLLSEVSIDLFNFWSSTPGLDEMANSFYLTYDRKDIFSEDMSAPASGRSVRCIKD